jgi:hypothetical protein
MGNNRAPTLSILKFQNLKISKFQNSAKLDWDQPNFYKIAATKIIKGSDLEKIKVKK